MSMKSFKLSTKNDLSLSEKFYMFRYNLWEKLPYPIKDFYWKVRGFLWDRHTTIKSRHLPHTWCDKDDILVYTTFEILEKFLEDECGEDGVVDWYTENEVTYCRMKKEYIIDIFREAIKWWNEEYVPFKNGDHPLEKKYLDCLPKLNMHDDEPTIHGDFITYPMTFEYSSEEHELNYNRLKDEYYKLEEDMEYKLNNYAALIWKFKRKMWT